jgi:hypothetical protein
MPIRTRLASKCITTMMPYHRPIPERKQRGRADAAPSGEQSQGGLGGGIITAWVQAEKMIQIAMVLPCAAFIGWLPGFWLDRHFHQTWMAIAGVVFGIIAGLVAAIRMAMVYANDPAMDKLDENGNEAGKSGKTGDSGTGS